MDSMRNMRIFKIEQGVTQHRYSIPASEPSHIISEPCTSPLPQSGFLLHQESGRQLYSAWSLVNKAWPMELYPTVDKIVHNICSGVTWHLVLSLLSIRRKAYWPAQHNCSRPCYKHLWDLSRQSYFCAPFLVLADCWAPRQDKSFLLSENGNRQCKCTGKLIVNIYRYSVLPDARMIQAW